VAHFHEMGHWWPWTSELETHEIVNINTSTAKTLGIKDGDLVVVENDHGKVYCVAWVNEMADEGSVWMPDAFDKYQPFYPYQDVNELIDDIVKDPFYTQVQYKCNLVRVYRSDQDPDEAVEKTKEFLRSLGKAPENYISPDEDDTVNLGHYMRFAKKGSGVYYKGVPREKWETK
jgi:formylmethanofuran dehydrogenase subunit D